MVGPNHYGRQRLLSHLIHTEDPLTWVIGTRRMGKTSLLRQLEWLCQQDAETDLVPLFWDLQGCETAQHLAEELFVAIEDVAPRFTTLGIDVPELEGQDVISILRRVQRGLNREGKRLFLLIDETEALINVAQEEDQLLARLRKLLQNDQHRVVMVATKSLMRLNDLSQRWLTSPFLFGVHIANLWQLDPESAQNLVTQTQSNAPVPVPEKTVNTILESTHCHPFIIQFLCHRLFDQAGEGESILRSITPVDLIPDQLLGDFFQIDFNHLSTLERRVLLSVAQHGLASSQTISAHLMDILPDRVEKFLYGLNKLGYVRQYVGEWAVGNEFLAYWMGENMARLTDQLESALSDHAVEEMLNRAQQIESDYLHQESSRQQTLLRQLMAQREQYNGNVPAALSDQIHATRRELERLAAELRKLRGESTA